MLWDSPYPTQYVRYDANAKQSQDLEIVIRLQGGALKDGPEALLHSDHRALQLDMAHQPSLLTYLVGCTVMDWTMYMTNIVRHHRSPPKGVRWSLCPAERPDCSWQTLAT